MTRPLPLPPIKYLAECFDLAPEEKEGLRWRERPRHHFKRPSNWVQTNLTYAGKPVGHPRDKGHFQVKVKGRYISSTRVIWAIAHNADPGDAFIDHRDGDPANNTLGNLRLASQNDNARNARLRLDNSSGQTGVYLKPNGRWAAEIKYERLAYGLGTYVEQEAAIAARRIAEVYFFREFAPCLRTSALPDIPDGLLSLGILDFVTALKKALGAFRPLHAVRRKHAALSLSQAKGLSCEPADLMPEVSP